MRYNYVDILLCDPIFPLNESVENNEIESVSTNISSKSTCYKVKH